MAGYNANIVNVWRPMAAIDGHADNVATGNAVAGKNQENAPRLRGRGGKSVALFNPAGRSRRAFFMTFPSRQSTNAGHPYSKDAWSVSDTFPDDDRLVFHIQ